MRIKQQDRQPLRAAAYIRVSTAMDEQEESFENQKLHFEELLAKSEKYENAGIYSDYGVSGTSIKKRDGLQSLLLDCRRGRINRIFCKSLSRLARNALEFLEILSLLNGCGTTIYFEKENLDTGQSLNEIVVTTLAAIAEEESISISENIRWGNAKRYAAGEVPNEPIYGYRWTCNDTFMPSGYKYRNVEVVPEEAKVVRRVFEEVANGTAYIDIARKLNAEKITPPFKKSDGSGVAKRCKRWHGRHIHSIIINERYTGCVKTQKTFTSDPLKHSIKRNRGDMEQYIVIDHHPAIITQELFDLVQIVIRRNSKSHGNHDAGTKRVQTLTGLLICPKCGRNFNCKGRSRIPYWYCLEEDCGLKIEEETVFKMLETAICIRFGDGDNLGDNIRRMYDEIDHIIAQKNQINNDLVVSQGRLAALEMQKSILENRLLDTTENTVRNAILRGIATLEKQLVGEGKKVEVLSNKKDECDALVTQGIQMYEAQEVIVSVIYGDFSFEEKLKKILHNNIRGLLAKVIVNSPAELSVYWLDNSITKVCRGVLND